MLNLVRIVRNHPRLRRISNLGIVTIILAFLYEGLLLLTWYPLQKLINETIEKREVVITNPAFLFLVGTYICVIGMFYVLEYFKYTMTLEAEVFFQNRTIEQQATQSLNSRANLSRAEQMSHYKVAGNAGDALVSLMAQLAPIALGVFFVIVAFSRFSYTLAGISVLTILISGFFLLIALPLLKEMRWQRIQDDASIDSAKMQRIEEYSIMHSFGIEGEGSLQVTTANDKMLREEVTRHAKWNFVMSFFNFIPTMAKAFLILFILKMMHGGVASGGVDIGVGIVLIGLALRLEQKSQEIQSLTHSLLGGKLSWDFLNRFRNPISSNQSKNSWPREMQGHIQLEEVSVTFTAADGHTVKALDDVTLEIQPGSCVVIYGPNGHGKTTLLKLLQQIHEYTGSVKIDGVELNDIDSKKYRQNYLAVVAQELDLVRGTVYSNVAISKPATSESEVEKALQTVGFNIPGGEVLPVHTNVSQFGDKLSGGQKQRISLARALHRDFAKILLIDEPTSALDDANSERIIAAFANLARKKEKTIIIVTHDQRFKNNSDFRVIYLQDGKIHRSAAA